MVLRVRGLRGVVSVRSSLICGQLPVCTLGYANSSIPRTTFWPRLTPLLVWVPRLAALLTSVSADRRSGKHDTKLQVARSQRAVANSGEALSQWSFTGLSLNVWSTVGLTLLTLRKVLNRHTIGIRQEALPHSGHWLP